MAAQIFLKLVFDERVRLLRQGEHLLTLQQWWASPDPRNEMVRYIMDCIDHADYLRRQVWGHDRDHYSKKIYTLKRRGSALVATWCRRDRLMPKKCVIYCGTSVHQLVDSLPY